MKPTAPSLSKYKTVLFDFDGVVVQSEKIKFLAYKNTFEELLFTQINDHRMEWVGLPEREVVQFFFDKHKVVGPIEEIILKKRLWYKNYLANNPLDFTPGVEAFIIQLKKENYKIGLVTSSSESEVKKVLETGPLWSLLDTLVCRDHVKNKKPDPEPYLLALQNLGVEANDTLIFEDSKPGVQAASKTGCDIILLLGSGLNPNFDPAIIMAIDNFFELL